MARMRPELTEPELRALDSKAEAKVYRALRDSLPNDFLVFHSLAWIYKSRRDAVVMGEADFTIFKKQSGFLTVEVKGGGIAFDARTGAWVSVDRMSTSHRIKDPFRQSQSEKFAVLDQIKGHPDWRKWSGRRILAGHAVFFPDLDSTQALAAPGRPIEIIGGKSNLEQIDQWIERTFQFWEEDGKCDPLGDFGLSLIEAIFSKTVEVRPLLSHSLNVEERTRIQLTAQQARVLRILGGRNRAVIAGGAGTGKTLIAVEKARALASVNHNVLFLCYNRPLADFIRLAVHDEPRIDVLTFHQLCETRVSLARRSCDRDLLAEARAAYPNTDRFDVQLPFALALANEVLQEKYDAVVVDEAQDFSDEFWFGVEEVQRNPKSGPLYLFTDPNQALYERWAKLPVKEEPFFLTVNCRNTAQIHKAAYRYYSGALTDPPEIDGVDLLDIAGRSVDEQAGGIVREINRLIVSEGITPDQIACLVLGRPKQQFYEAIEGQRLANKTGWGIESRIANAVLIDTVKRFKGLEASIVFLWLPLIPLQDEDREALYVGLSRAKSMIYIVGMPGRISEIRSP